MRFINCTNKIKKLFILLLFLITSAIPAFAGDDAWAKIERGWSRMPIRVYLDNTGNYSDMIKAGFADWEEKTDEEVRFKFVTKPHRGYANITVRLVRNFTDNTVGRTNAQMGVNNIYKSRIDIGLFSPSGRRFSKPELEIVIRHEIGHALGLPHSKNQKSIMFPYVLPGQSIIDENIKNLLELY